MTPLTTAEAWAELLAGNRRLVEGTTEHPRRSREVRDELVADQHPVAAVLACADSRAPIEILFDQGFGDTFVVRTAGPILSESTIGSLEYAVVVLHVPLIVVLTHEGCGAIAAAREVRGDSAALTGYLPSIISGIDRSVLDDEENPEALHARQLVRGLLARSHQIAQRVEAGTLGVVGAFYELGTGVVQEVVPLTV